MNAGMALAGPARIGPNAITQCMAALQADLGLAGSRALMDQAGLQAHVQHPPQHMVDEADVIALHRTMRSTLGVAKAQALARVAGQRTGDYLLANRIPRPVQWALKRLPAAWAARVLLAAITRHAWTFCGSGCFEVLPARQAREVQVSITGCITCHGEQAVQPLGDYYAATFERLFSVLVHPAARVVESACEAQGAPACVFDIGW